MANKHNKSINRRSFIQLSGAAAAGPLLSQPARASEPVTAPFVGGRQLQAASLPTKKGPRLLIVGGGWAGLTLAKYAKQIHPDFDVVLLDQNEAFVSCPVSSSWLAGQVSYAFLCHSYYEAAKNHNYLFLQAAVVDVDRDARTVFTQHGTIEYDYLALAPGIDYDYTRMGVDDPELQLRLQMHYPGGFKDASELLTIKRKLDAFAGGTFAMTIPGGNYRCTAAPYERVCMAAAVFKKRKLDATIKVLDTNPGIRIKEAGFTRAFEEVYGDIVDYEPSVEITGVNVDTQEIETDFDVYGFDDALIYPPVRASRLLEHLGVINPDSPEKSANTHPFNYHVMGDERVYVLGDSRSQPFSKSGNTAHTEAKYVAEVIAAHISGKEVEWRSPQTMCFSGVTIDPLQSMSIVASYRYDAEEKAFAFGETKAVETWSAAAGTAGLAWAEAMYTDLFYGG